MTIGSTGTATAAQARAATGIEKTSDSDPTAFARILDAFRKEAAKTPVERARDEVLKKHHLTEASYKALPPEQKKAIDAEIAIAAQRALHADKGKGFKGAETAASLVPGTSFSL